jgi:predicted YcjX-like family ATPase
MRLPDVTVSAVDAVRSAGAYVSEKLTPTVRLGVTGLSGAGKTVFITALVRNLIAGGRLPFLKVEAEGRLLRAWLEPQPDDSLPRFELETHCASLAADPPRWPESTRRISELRLVLEYLPGNRLLRQLGSRRLYVDIVDYPGEWLVDLGLLDQRAPARVPAEVAGTLASSRRGRTRPHPRKRTGHAPHRDRARHPGHRQASPASFEVRREASEVRSGR